MTSCHGPFGGVLWSHVLGQEPSQELVQTPAILKHEIYQDSELAITLPVPCGGTVHCLTSIVIFSFTLLFLCLWKYLNDDAPSILTIRQK